MPRPRKFGREEAIDAALAVFWRNGYESSSIQDLLAAMQINRGSLYNSFTSKEDLFIEVLDRYQQRLDERVTQTLVQIKHPIQAIRAFMYASFLDLDENEREQGCLYLNTITELRSLNDRLADEASTRVDRLRQLIESRLLEAQRESLLALEKDPALLSDQMLSTLAGLCLFYKMGAGEERVKAVIDNTLALLH